jgi:hypothetical protein
VDACLARVILGWILHTQKRKREDKKRRKEIKLKRKEICNPLLTKVSKIMCKDSNTSSKRMDGHRKGDFNSRPSIKEEDNGAGRGVQACDSRTRAEAAWASLKNNKKYFIFIKLKKKKKA